MCYRNVIIGLSFKTVPKTGILVFREKVLPFSGGATGARIGCGMSLFGGILVSKINVLPFSGVQPAPGSGEACPFLGHSCFQNKCFAVFRGATGARIG